MLFLIYWTSIIFIRLGWHLLLKQRESRIFMKAFDRFFLTLHLINQKIVKALVMLVQWSKVKTNKRTKTNNGPHKNTHKSSYWVIKSQLKIREEVMCSEEYTVLVPQSCTRRVTHVKNSVTSYIWYICRDEIYSTKHGQNQRHLCSSLHLWQMNWVKDKHALTWNNL
jgi:hypothetical protein